MPAFEISTSSMRIVESPLLVSTKTFPRAPISFPSLSQESVTELPPDVVKQTADTRDPGFTELGKMRGCNLGTSAAPEKNEIEEEVKRSECGNLCLSPSIGKGLYSPVLAALEESVKAAARMRLNRGDKKRFMLAHTRKPTVSFKVRKHHARDIHSSRYRMFFANNTRGSGALLCRPSLWLLVFAPPSRAVHFGNGRVTSVDGLSATRIVRIWKLHRNRGFRNDKLAFLLHEPSCDQLREHVGL